jgi:Domain of unknown function (DUF4917)
MPAVVDAKLLDWNGIKEAYEWSGLLLGNGASRAMWEPFAYTSLFDKAGSNEVTHPLRDADSSLFAAMNTLNFESVLSGLSVSRLVCDVLGIDSSSIEERYDHIKQALVEAVHAVHIPWLSVPDDILLAPSCFGMASSTPPTTICWCIGR